MRLESKRIAALLLCVSTALSLVLPAAAAEIKYMPDVTAEMSHASYWAKLHENADEVTAMQYIPKLLDRITDTPHIHQRAHDSTNHISQETVRTNCKNKQIIIPFCTTPLSLYNVADIGFII